MRQEGTGTRAGTHAGTGTGTTRRKRRSATLAGLAAVLALAGCTGGAPRGLGPVGAGAAPAAAPAMDVRGVYTATPAPGATLGATAGGAKDIGWARSVIEQGGIPDAASITVEGLYSESDLPLEGGTPRGLLSIDLGTAVAEGAHLVQVGMSSSLDPATWKRAPLDLCVVVDVSGSMNEWGKIEATKHALRAMLGKLRDEEDRIAVVAFNQSAWVALEPCTFERANTSAAAAAIDRLTGNGSTNMHAGLELGYAQIAAMRGGREGRNARLILFTDALPNQGNFSDRGFTDLATKYGREGIGLTAFGVGLDFGHGLARKIAECPGGNYKFLRSKEDIQSVFEADFDYLVTPLAYDLALEVTPAPGFEVAEAYGFPGGERNGLKVATVFLSRNKGALALRLRRTGAPATPRSLGEDLGGLARLCDVRLRYRREADGEAIEEIRTALAPALAGPEREHFSHRGVRKTLALTMLAIAMKDACARPGDAKAAERLDHARSRAAGEAKALEDQDLVREAALAAKLLANVEAQTSMAGR